MIKSQLGSFRSIIDRVWTPIFIIYRASTQFPKNTKTKTLCCCKQHWLCPNKVPEVLDGIGQGSVPPWDSWRASYLTGSVHSTSFAYAFVWWWTVGIARRKGYSLCRRHGVYVFLIGVERTSNLPSAVTLPLNSGLDKCLVFTFNVLLWVQCLMRKFGDLKGRYLSLYVLLIFVLRIRERKWIRNLQRPLWPGYHQSS